MRNNPLPLSAVHPRGSRAVWKRFPFNGNHGGERPGKQGRSKGRSNGEESKSAQQARRGKPRLDTSDSGRRFPSCEDDRSEEHTSELQSLMRNSYAVFCLKKKTPPTNKKPSTPTINIKWSIKHNNTQT